MTKSTVHVTLSVLALLAFVCFQYQMLFYREFGDESETIIAARMIASGQTLYAEIFNHHGPHTFLLALGLESISNFGVAAHRVPVMLLQWALVISVIASPNLGKVDQKLLAGILTTAILAVGMILTNLNTNTYQVVVGLLLAIAMVQFVIPAVFSPEKLTGGRTLFGAVILISLPWFAVWYLPTSLLLLLVGFQRRHWRWAAFGASAALALGLLFLAVFGSISGYLVDHIFVNGVVMADYERDASWIGPMNPRGILSALILLVLPVLTVFLSFILGRRDEKSPYHWRMIFLTLGLVALIYRGVSIQAIPFYLASVMLLIVILNHSNHISKCLHANFRIGMRSVLVMTSVALVAAVSLSFWLPTARQHVIKNIIPPNTDFAILAGILTDPADRVIVYPFQNYEYIAANRLPASGDFFLLPWQEDDRLRAFPGSDIDACAEISQYRPKLMLITPDAIWSAYPWMSYGSCVQEFADSNYINLEGTDIYVRADLESSVPGRK